MICPNCHTENRPGAKFCNECGQKLEEAQERELDEREIEEVAPAADGEAEPAAAAEDAEATDEAAEAVEVAADETADAQAADEAPSAVVDEAAEEADEPATASEGAEADGPAAVSEDAEADGPAAVSEDACVPDDEELPEPLARTGTLPRINIVADKPAAAEEPERPKADLSGFDEYLVNPGYVPAPSAWRAGDTLQMPALKDVEGPKQKEFKAPTDPQKPARTGKGKGGKIAAIVVAVLVVAAAIAAGATYQMELWGGKVVPDVTGMTQADATFVLEGKGFTVRTTSVASDETEGVVLLMDPGANARQQEGSEVVIHVSTSRLVPDVVGKSQEEAERLLSDNGFENVTYVQERSDEAAGTVLFISPDAGEKAKAKSAITVTVAEPYTVPDVTGMTPIAAAAAIEEAGLTSRTVTVYNESIPEGYMIGIDPVSGSEVTSETVVTISVAKSRGTELTAAARNYLAGGSLKASDGSTFTISSVNSCTYKGNDEVSFTATGVASTSVTVLGQTLSVSGDSKQVSGTIGFDAYNNVVSISFS